MSLQGVMYLLNPDIIALLEVSQTLIYIGVNNIK